MNYIVNVDTPTRKAKVHKVDCYSLQRHRENPENGYRKPFTDLQSASAYVQKYVDRGWDAGVCGL